MANFPYRPEQNRDPSGQKQTQTPQEKNDTGQSVDRSSVKVDPGKDSPKEQSKPSAHRDNENAAKAPDPMPNPANAQSGLQQDIDHYKRLDEDGKAQLKKNEAAKQKS